MFTTNRVYEKRATEKSAWDGRIGAVELIVKAEGDDVVMTLDGKVLPKASVEHLLNFALQTLQDAYAGAESLDEARGNFEKKRDKLVAGEIGIRGGEGISVFQSVARSIVRALLKREHGAKSEKWTAFTAMEDKEQNAKLDEIFERNREKLEPAVTAELERRKAEAAKKREIMEGISL